MTNNQSMQDYRPHLSNNKPAVIRVVQRSLLNVNDNLKRQ